MNKPTSLSIDFETASQADLKRTGSFTYAAHPSTRVLCMAYAFDDGLVSVWRIDQPFPQPVLDHVRNMGEVRAWNAAFEFNIWNQTLRRQLLAHNHLYLDELSLAQVRDTMAQAAFYGLPLSLDQAARAAGVQAQKSKEGHALMLRMCRPRSVDPVTGQATWWHETDAAKFDTLCAYCAQDVEVEREISARLRPLPSRELEIWRLDQRMNQHGVSVDFNFVNNLKDVALAAGENINVEVSHLTGGAVPRVTNTAALLGYLQGLGYPHDSLTKDKVAERLETLDRMGVPDDHDERLLLTLRADGAKTSAKKLDAMIGAVLKPDGVAPVRGMLQYYGASRTGRWAGRLIQMQNLPRGDIKNDKKKGARLDAAIAMIENGANLSMVELFFGSGLRFVSSMLRSCIVPCVGHKLVVRDFAQIEARVLPWLAGQEDVLDVFRSGGDVYVQAAAPIFGRQFPTGHKFVKDDIPDEERQIGKVAVLALGFGGGKGAFQTMAAAYGIKVSDAEAENIKTAWRAANPQTVQFWWDLDNACRRVLRDPNLVVQVGRFIKVGKVGKDLVIVLPSGRGLFYRDAKLEVEVGADRDSITYMGVNQYTRKWERIRTYGGKLAENVTQATARDVMAEAMLRADADPALRADQFHLILTIHDELLGEAPAAFADATNDRLAAIMDTPPDWAAGLPVGSDGWVGDRYRK